MNNISVKVKIIRCVKRMIFFYLGAFLMFPAFLEAQTYYFDNYTTENGLPQNKIYTILQDHEGYVWLGTPEGVSRFDGKYFRNYTAENNIAEGGVRTIFEDSNKNIWFGHNDGGVSRIKNEQMEVYENSKLLFKNDITSIIEDDDGRLWITSEGSGAVLFSNINEDLIDMKYEQYKGKRLSDRAYNTAKTKKGIIYFVTDVGIKEYDKESNTFNNLVIDNLPRYFQIICVFEDSKENLWFGTHHGGLYKYEKDNDTLIIYDAVRDGIANNFVSYITEDKNGNIWVGTFGGGITVFRGSELRTYNTQNGLNNNIIRCIVEDFEGNMLIGNDQGLSLFKGEQFIAITEEDGLNNSQVWAILQDRKDRYWFGTDGGITLYDPKESKYNEFMYYTESNSSIGDKIRFLKEDRNGNIWIAAEGLGINQFLINTQEFYYNSLLNSHLEGLPVTAMEIDDNNNLWVGTYEGLGYFEIDNNSIAEKRLTQTDGLSGNDITALYYDSKKILWIGAKRKGITLYNDRDTTFTIIKELGTITAKSITEDKNGNFWIGTDVKGVLVFDGKAIIKQYKEQDGMLSNNVAFVNVDEDDNIYVGTSKGLNRIDQEKDKIYTYTQKNGFVGIEAKDNSTYRDEQGNMWFGTTKGAIKYDVHLNLESNPEALTHIDNFYVNGGERDMSLDIKLNHRDKSIAFDFNSICLTNPEAVSYQYMLEGANEWQPVTKSTNSIYPLLPPGRYTFKVRAKNSEGIWNKTPASYTFTIRPPFYKTIWFILPAIILGLFGVISFIKMREKNLIREKKILEDKVVERTTEVVQKSQELEEKNRDIMDSIRYAKRIQDAILPPEVPFGDTFILFKPKDIVSGDFYWLETAEDKEMIAAVDCTGHGVPGAFMSIIGHNMLTKIVKEYGITEPAAILDQLNVEISNTLHQKGETVVNDGMDLALLSFDKKKFTLEYAGAFNPLFLIRKGELEEIKANRFAIGRSTTVEKKKFDNQKIKLKKGDAVYISSDGYADQFGGPQGKKFKSKPMKEMLLSIQDLSMAEQKKHLDKTIENWKGSLEQIDDIVFIGRKF